MVEEKGNGCFRGGFIRLRIGRGMGVCGHLFWALFFFFFFLLWGWRSISRGSIMWKVIFRKSIVEFVIEYHNFFCQLESVLPKITTVIIFESIIVVRGGSRTDAPCHNFFCFLGANSSQSEPVRDKMSPTKQRPFRST